MNEYIRSSNYNEMDKIRKIKMDEDLKLSNLDEIDMTDEIISIDIILENCESYNIPVKCINFIIDLDDRNIYPESILYNESPYVCTKNVHLLITDSDEIKPFYNWSSSILNRLSECNDITSITFNYKDQPPLRLEMPYNLNDSFDSNNTYQTTKILQRGYAIIDIKK